MASFLIKDRLQRLYPMPSKRLAPDFFFQPQIYRADGESVHLPAGCFTFEYTGGPEYLTRTRQLTADSSELSFPLERWIDPSTLGWYSGDHHVHAAGCSHYMNPTGGRPADRQDAPDPGRTSQQTWKSRASRPATRAISFC